MQDDGYATRADSLPGDLTEAIFAFERSALARRALGPAVHEPYVRLASAERDVARRSVIDWDLRRGFERA